MISGHINNGVVRDGEDTQLCTFTGTMVNVLNPRTDQIKIEDIAHAIGNLCRFNGHTRVFYSVAQHSVLGSKFAQKWFGSDELAREFLLHDGTEAYAGDMIRPLKVHDPIFAEIEDGFWGAVSERFEQPRDMTPECKSIDDIMVTWEKRDLLPHAGEWPNLPNIEVFNFPRLKPWNPVRAQKEFMKQYDSLFGVAA